MRGVRARTAVALVTGALAAGAAAARAQSIEPRAYSNAPVGVNFMIAGYAYTLGGVSFDPSLPITDPHLGISSALLAYARSLAVGGASGKFDAIVPYSWLSGSADYAGKSLRREVGGPMDPLFRLSVNFVGAPAMTAREFGRYRQDLIVGASVQVSAPWGQYDESRLVNIGSNRWWFKPELGVSKALRPWTIEAKAAATLYADNRDFYGGHTRTQAPLYWLSGHVIYSSAAAVWVSGDVMYFTGGRSSIDGTLSNDLQQNWRVGGTLALPVSARHSVKLSASAGAWARTGNNYSQAGLAWQYRWGGGL